MGGARELALELARCAQVTGRAMGGGVGVNAGNRILGTLSAGDLATRHQLKQVVRKSRRKQIAAPRS